MLFLPGEKSDSTVVAPYMWEREKNPPAKVSDGSRGEVEGEDLATPTYYWTDGHYCNEPFLAFGLFPCQCHHEITFSQ